MSGTGGECCAMTGPEHCLTDRETAFSPDDSNLNFEKTNIVPADIKLVHYQLFFVYQLHYVRLHFTICKYLVSPWRLSKHHRKPDGEKLPRTLDDEERSRAAGIIQV